MAAHKRIDKAALALGYEAIAIEHGVNVWEFLPGIDAPQSYTYFALYRDMGLNRSLEKLCVAIKGEKNENFYKNLKFQSSDGFWVDRAAAYDLYLERIRREELEKKSIKDHVRKLRNYRASLEDLGWKNLAIAQECLEIGQIYVTEIKARPDTIHRMKTQDFRNIMGASSSCGEQALKTLSEALAVAKLLEQIELDGDEDDYLDVESVSVELE